MPAQIQISRQDMVNYIQSTLMGGMNKATAYKAHIDPLVKDVYGAISRLEKRNEFVEMHQSIVDSDKNAANKLALRVKSKYLSMAEKNLDVASDLLDKANSDESKAKAVRLANETFGAMSIIGVAQPQENTPLKLDKSSVVL